jgi:predicted HTH transcriptional regulator
MRIYKDLDMVKQLCFGMNGILSHYKKDIFIFDEDFLRMIFISNHDKIETTQEIRKLSTREKILLALKRDSFLTREELAKLLVVSVNAIKQQLIKFKLSNEIKRVGSRKVWYWKILDD